MRSLTGKRRCCNDRSMSDVGVEELPVIPGNVTFNGTPPTSIGEVVAFGGIDGQTIMETGIQATDMILNDGSVPMNTATSFQTDLIDEATLNSGTTINSVLVKDRCVSAALGTTVPNITSLSGNRAAFVSSGDLGQLAISKYVKNKFNGNAVEFYDAHYEPDSSYYIGTATSGIFQRNILKLDPLGDVSVEEPGATLSADNIDTTSVTSTTTLDIDSTTALTLGNTTATSVALGRAGVTTTARGLLVPIGERITFGSTVDLLAPSGAATCFISNTGSGAVTHFTIGGQINYKPIQTSDIIGFPALAVGNGATTQVDIGGPAIPTNVLGTLSIAGSLVSSSGGGYQYINSTSSFSGPFTVPPSAAYTITVIGKSLSLVVGAISSASTVATYATMTAILPVALRPSVDIWTYAPQTISNSVLSYGTIVVRTTGVIEIGIGDNIGNFAATGNAGWASLQSQWNSV